MLPKKYTHLFQKIYLQGFSTGESKFVYQKGPAQPKISAKEIKEKEERIKAMEKVAGKDIKKAEGYRNSVATGPKYEKEKVKIRDGVDLRKLVKDIAGKYPQKYRKQLSLDMLKVLQDSLSANNMKLFNELANNSPLDVSFDKGIINFSKFEKGKKKLSISINILLEAPSLKLLNKYEKLKTDLLDAQTKKREALRKTIKPSENLMELRKKGHEHRLVKKKDYYLVKFYKGKTRRIDRKAELKLKIQDILDLAGYEGSNVYIRIHVKPRGKAGYEAYYDRDQNTFFNLKTMKRVKIWHNTKIKVIEYRVAKPEDKPEKEPRKVPSTPKIKKLKDKYETAREKLKPEIKEYSDILLKMKEIEIKNVKIKSMEDIRKVIDRIANKFPEKFRKWLKEDLTKPLEKKLGAGGEWHWYWENFKKEPHNVSFYEGKITFFAPGKGKYWIGPGTGPSNDIYYSSSRLKPAFELIKLKTDLDIAIKEASKAPPKPTPPKPEEPKRLDLDGIKKRYEDEKKRLKPESEYFEALKKLGRIAFSNVRITSFEDIQNNIIKKLVEKCPEKYKKWFEADLTGAAKKALSADNWKTLNVLKKASPIKNVDLQQGHMLGFDFEPGGPLLIDLFDGSVSLAKLAKLDEHKVKTDKVSAYIKRYGRPPTAEELKEYERTLTRGGEIETTKDYLWNKWYNVVFKNERFYTPKFLRGDRDFEKWGRLERRLSRVLARPPFNCDFAQGKKYLQEVIQDYYNSRLYAEDFFKIRLPNGQYLYKNKKGYDKIRKDHKKLLEKEEAGTLTDKETKQLDRIVDIFDGIANVFEVLSTLEKVKVRKESARDKFKPVLLGVPTLSGPELIEAQSGVKYHSMESLMHKKEYGAKSISIGINPKMTNKINDALNKNEFPPGTPQGKGFDLAKKYVKEKGGLKLLFMMYGFEGLVKRKCLKKLDKDHYILVDVPKDGWGQAFKAMHKENIAKYGIWDTHKDAFKRWERIRAAIDKKVKARRFIAKIFAPKQWKVKQNINWWQKMWHWNLGRDAKVTMGNLGKVTLNPRDFEKYFAERRGYLDMMHKASKRVEGTNIYEPVPEEVLKHTNQYLEYGILGLLMRTKDKKLPDVMSKLQKQFNVRIPFKKPFKDNKVENLNLLLNQIRVKNLDPASLSKTHIRFIRMGYALGRQLEISRNMRSSVDKLLPANPARRAIIKEMLSKGLPVTKIREADEKLKISAFVFGKGTKAGAGGAISYNFGDALGLDRPLWVHVGLFGMDGKVMPALGFDTYLKKGGKFRIRFGVSTTPQFAGAALAFEWKATKTWDTAVGASFGVDFTGTSVGIAVFAGMTWNQHRAGIEAAKKQRNVFKHKEIRDVLKKGDEKKALKLILEHPIYGGYIKAVKEKFKMPDSEVIELFKFSDKELENKAKANMYIPPITSFGAGLFVGPSLKGGNPFIGGGIYLTFRIPGTRVTYVVRHGHPVYNQRRQRQLTEVELKRHLEKQGVTNYKIAGYTISGTSGLLYFDPKLGRANVTRPRNSKDLKEQLGLQKSKVEKNVKYKGRFDALKKKFAEIGLIAELVPTDPKDPKKGSLIALTPNRVKASNVEMLIDPTMKSKGLVLDQQNNRVLLTADAVKNLFVSRATYEYPFRKSGAMNLTVITFKDNKHRTNMQIREDSKYYIYKYRGEKYHMERGDNRRQLPGDNVMTLKEFRKRIGKDPNKYEAFRDKKFEFNLSKNQTLSRNMRDAITTREAPKVNAEQKQLKKYGEWWYKGKNKRRFNSLLVSISVKKKNENKIRSKIFEMITNDYKKFAKENNLPANLTLNAIEKNIVYNYLLHQSYIALRGGKAKTVEKRLKARNKLFRNYMKTYISNFKKTYPKQWEEFRKLHPRASISAIANFMTLKLPQNITQLRDADKKPLRITGGLKYASYTKKKKKEALPTAFGWDVPKGFEDIFTLIGTKKLNVNSPNPIENASARLILQMMSPLHLEKMDTAKGKIDFLQSELPLLLLSIEDTKTKISPMIDVLGTTSYERLTKIYEAIKKGPKEFNTVVTKYAKTFEKFNKLVLKIRDAQLNGKKQVKEGTYTFHLRTSINVGAYSKCGNGSPVIRQEFGLSTTKTKKVLIGLRTAQTRKKVATGAEVKASFKTLTLGGGYAGRKPGKQPPRKEEPPDRGKPGKGEVPDRGEGGRTPFGGGETPSGETPPSTPGTGGETPPAGGGGESSPWG